MSLRTVGVLLQLGLIGLGALGCEPGAKTVGVEPAQVQLTSAGQSVQLKLTAKDQAGQVLAGPTANWLSSDPRIATVVDGKVTAVKSGLAIITARVGLVSGTTKVTVAVATKVQVVPAKVELVGIGARARVAARVIDESGGNVAKAELAWTSSDEKVMRVLPGEGDGAEVKAVGFGKATLGASFAAGKLKGEGEVEVKMPRIESVDVTPAELTLKVAATQKLEVALTSQGGASVQGMPVTWTSSDEKVATVAADGTVTAVAKGRAEISAASGENKATARLKVEK